MTGIRFCFGCSAQAGLTKLEYLKARRAERCFLKEKIQWKALCPYYSGSSMKSSQWASAVTLISHIKTENTRLVSTEMMEILIRRFYFDKSEYKTREELIEKARIDGVKVCDLEDTVTVTECDGCYPDSTEAFRALMRE